jgi:hypothetical protein
MYQSTDLCFGKYRGSSEKCSECVDASECCYVKNNPDINTNEDEE